MNDYCIQIADAVTAELNDPARAWANTWATTAVRSYMPNFSDEELKELRVSVVALTQPSKRASRSTRLFEYGVLIVFQKFVSAGDTAGIDTLVNLVGQMRTWFENYHCLATMPTYGVDDCQNDPIFDPTMLDEKSTFESLIALTIRGER